MYKSSSRMVLRFSLSQVQVCTRDTSVLHPFPLVQKCPASHAQQAAALTSREDGLSLVSMACFPYV